MNSKKWAASLLALGVVGILAFPHSGLAQTKTYEFTYSIFFPAPHKHTVLAGEWAKEVEKRTHGKVKITLFPGGTLTPASTCYDGVVKGLSDMGMSVLGYTKGKFPLTEVIDLPLGYQSGLVATRLINQYYQKFKPKEFDEVKVLYLHAHGPGILHSKRAVAKLEDLKGMRIRCTGTVTEIVKALGGLPMSMPMGETYDALNRGMVEGSMAPMESLEGWKWGEVVKFTTESYGSGYSTGFFVVMNKERWNALPADIQKTIDQVSSEWVDKTGKLWDDADHSGREFSLKLGNKIISLSGEENRRWASAAKPVLNEYMNHMKEKGLPGEEALRFCVEFLKKTK
ncbi:MAG TPA: TRAP transporter substrate-binding protein [Thermodesulfobacteriota bacterium]|nr:TRAP transporter substrate-binding protein [Thermodesulfobacteriota bacterium]